MSVLPLDLGLIGNKSVQTSQIIAEIGPGPSASVLWFERWKIE